MIVSLHKPKISVQEPSVYLIVILNFMSKIFVELQNECVVFSFKYYACFYTVKEDLPPCPPWANACVLQWTFCYDVFEIT